ncbi:MAG: glycosyltransferase family 2 protein [Roseicyclus sp.]
MTGTLAITMAGRGSRFAAAGFDRPKYEIEVLGLPLFDWAMASLAAFRDAGWRFSFAVRTGLGAEDFVAARAGRLGLGEVTVIGLDTVTDGQATTAMRIAETAPEDAPFAVYNIDTFVAPGAMIPPDPASCAGWIPCFPGPGAGWSFARTDAIGNVVEVREKVRISADASVGLYWFDCAARYTDAYRGHYGAPGREEEGERYVAPLYNHLIAEGARVRLSRLRLEDVGMLGTPEEVAAFAAHPSEAARRLAEGRMP